MQTLGRISFALLLSSLSQLSHAGPIVDQNQDRIGGRLATFSATGLAQSFHQTNDNIAGAGLFLTAVPDLLLGYRDDLVVGCVACPGWRDPTGFC
jgi:hypothetical protein